MEKRFMENTNKGILYTAMTLEKRERFIRHRDRVKSKYDDEFDAMASYILSEECVNDLRSLIERNYTMPPPYHFRVAKNLSARKRDVYAYKGNFKYLLKLIAYCMRDFEDIYSEGLYSFQSNKTAKDFLLKLRGFDHVEDYYIVKADVSSYVNSIVPEKIIPQLEALWPDDPTFTDFLKHMLLRRECIEWDGNLVKCEPGGLGGLPISNLFMNVYLMELDEYFDPIAPLYCRYSDDIIIFARTREEALAHIEKLHQVLKEKDLKTNPDKTYLIEPGGEVDILGAQLKNGKMDVSPFSKQKLKRKIRMRCKRLLRLKRKNGWSDEECGQRMVQYCNRLFFGDKNRGQLTWARWLFPVITETSSLQELDHYMQNAIRYCMCGSMADKRYRTTYDDLKKMGYFSLVHAYYHFERPEIYENF